MTFQRSLAAVLGAVAVLSLIACSGSYTEPQPVQPYASSPDGSVPPAGDFVGGATGCPSLAGTWAGPINVRIVQTGADGVPMEQTVNAPESPPFQFDDFGRPLFDFQKGQREVITHVGQVRKVLHSPGVSTYTVRELTFSDNGCRCVIDCESDRYTSTGLPGQQISDTVLTTTRTVMTFQLEADGLHTELQMNSTTKTSINSNFGGSTGGSGSSSTIKGVLQRR